MHKYILPDAEGNIVNMSTEKSSMIIIGANGAGKSRLGVWIEKNQSTSTHRIGAQRSLMFGEYIQQKSYEQSTNLLIYGTERRNANHDVRWKKRLDNKGSYISTVLEDYEYVLSALVAKKAMQQDEYLKECRKLEIQGREHNAVPEMVTDQLKRIWSSVFPHRNIEIIDGKIVVSFENEGAINTYMGKEMSDGERVALYLIAQVLVIPPDKTLIVDEPEIHLHRSIMNRLWESIEQERKDCFFIYITHDTQFAAKHKDAIKIWVKNYDGKNWSLEEVTEGELPEQLLLDILGNRKPVLFVEGTADSYDTKLYSELYKDYYVVACGSCSNVIAWTKAMNKTLQLHDLKCHGIIDRDYRSDYEIEKYRKDNIYVLGVAEVENLFIVPEILGCVNEIMGYQDGENVDRVINYVVEERFANEYDKQICEAVVADLKYRLSSGDISSKDDESAKDALDKLWTDISYDSIKEIYERKFVGVYEAKDYREILKVFNKKSLSTSTGQFFGLSNKGYCDFVIRQLFTDKREKIVKAVEVYLPEEIPR